MSDKEIESIVIQKFSLQAIDKQFLNLHLVCKEQEFDFALSPEAASNLKTALEQGLNKISN